MKQQLSFDLIPRSVTGTTPLLDEEHAILPDGWQWRKISDPDVAELVMGQSPASDTYNTEGVGLPFYQGKADFGSVHPTPRFWCKSPQRIAIKDDILISVRAPVGPTNISAEECCIGRGLAAIRAKALADSRFIFYYLRSIESQITALGQGSTFASITKTQLADIYIPIPSLPEQHRIVVWIEAFAQRVDETQMLRQEAVEWADSLMPEARWQAFEYLINNGAAKQPLENVTNFLGRGRSTQQGNSEFRLIKTRHVYPDGLKPFDDCRLSNQEAARCSPERILQPGDVLVCSSAAGSLGRPGFFTGFPHPCTTDSHVAIVRSIPELLDPSYLFHYFQSPQGQFELLSREQGGKWQEEKVGFRLTELNLADLRTVPVPMPPLDEQRRFATHLDGLQAKADAIRAAQAETQKELDTLLPAVLDRAFRGEL